MYLVEDHAKKRSAVEIRFSRPTFLIRPKNIFIEEIVTNDSGSTTLITTDVSSNAQW